MALASPLESIESAVIWLLVVFSVATWGLAPVSYTHLTLPTNREV